MSKKINYKDLKIFTKKILSKVGLDKFSLESVTHGLCEASLRGVESHGIRLLPHYVNSALQGRKNPKPKFKFKKNFISIGSLDADNAFGHAAGVKALNYCVKIAKRTGVGVVSVKNSSHPGALASIALPIARKGYMVFAFTHADSLLLSHNGIRPYFGTNPICFAAPRNNDEPFCLDMATSMISWNKLLMHRAKKKNLANLFAADKKGKSTIDPFLAKSLFGAGSYKGYGLASMVEILCGIYTGMKFGRSIPAMYTTSIKKARKLGQFYMVIRTDGCISKRSFYSRMSKMSQEVRKEPKSFKKKVMLPNDIENQTMRKQIKNGVQISDSTVGELKKLSEKHKVRISFRK